ncbi:uncharacterized protein MONBRDRAFT_14194 [Monosiga brevicollis MX1]|uniref:Alanine--tRNA ligase n=1 Tax=Monosiga brevicollis TaxID=81824 RepID=A9URD2_MONBE|nr:uncharacterized protein MONBRDRAFT_14194 [Monosiga brevicollis MX1]EDQ92223.1 predicted protein [Monosiga brevicollis MX1]|eukprot:XP_001743509.1 hypothetical protein [Monosiga brevicollis MX1]
MAQEQDWNAAKVRQTYIDFFVEKKEHVFWPSSSSVPHDDPTLLFCNAGMNQFKKVFQGTVDPNSDMAKVSRTVNSQKCIRAGGKHNDLDDVGKDTYHHTFFEMLGNWSFGDYFKAEAIQWSFELLTEVYGLSADRLYATYFEGDTEQNIPEDVEAKELWLKLLPADHVLPGNKKDNFWEMGATGPCGPCSELHYDRIGGRNAASLVNQDDPDVLEIWNLVFMQFNREPDASLRLLPARHIDTGMGLERLVSVLQDKRSNYDTDVFQPYFDVIQQVCGCRPYAGKVGKEDDGIDTAYRVLADHIRTLTISISDGGEPDNTGRGYVLRLIIRRAVRFAEDYLKAPEYFFSSLVPTVVEQLGDAFPEIKRDPEHVIEVLKAEEKQFRRTLNRGRRLFQRAADKATDGVIDGHVAWQLWGTYGFPVDLTKVMAEERGLTVDEKTFEAAREEAVKVSQMGKKMAIEGIDLDVHDLDKLKADGIAATDDSFKYDYGLVGDNSYEFKDLEAKVVALRTESGFVDSLDGSDDSVNVGVVLDRTNFYAEQGGQTYDTGFFRDANGELDFTVMDVQKKGPYCLHIGVLSNGTLKVGDTLTLSFDVERRRPCMSNHTATHVLNFALRKVLGEADQKGSLVEPERLRFDFTAKKGMTIEQIQQTEKLVNEVVNAKKPVDAMDAPLASAREINGLRAMFGETYPDPVRVVSVGAIVKDVLDDPVSEVALANSIEFCGGTHVKNSGDIVQFAILNEEAISKGIRRIVAVTGSEARKAQTEANRLDAEVRDDLTMKEVVALDTEVSQAAIPATRKDAIRSRLKALHKKHSDVLKERRKAMAGNAEKRAKELLEEEAKPVVVEVLEVGANGKAIGEALKVLKVGRPDTAFMFFGVEEGGVAFNCMVPEALVAKGLKAGDWVSEVNKVLGGRGGGRDLVAQGSADQDGKVSATFCPYRQWPNLLCVLTLTLACPLFVARSRLPLQRPRRMLLNSRSKFSACSTAQLARAASQRLSAS